MPQGAASINALAERSVNALATIDHIWYFIKEMVSPPSGTPEIHMKPKCRRNKYKRGAASAYEYNLAQDLNRKDRALLARKIIKGLPLELPPASISPEVIEEHFKNIIYG